MLQKLGMVANTCNPSTQETNARGSEAQGNLSYAVWTTQDLTLKGKQTNKREMGIQVNDTIPT